MDIFRKIRKKIAHNLKSISLIPGDGPALFAVIGFSIFGMIGISCHSGEPIQNLKVKILKTYDHDPGAFTQGLLWHDGKLYESTGLYGESTVRRVEPVTGIVEKSHSLSKKYFGEGLALVGDRLIMLTWQEKTAIVFSRDSFQVQTRYEYQGEGWGLCYDGHRLVMSNGSEELIFRDAENFKETGRIKVTYLGFPVKRINELECVNGTVYANVWRKNTIVQIDPETGRVIAQVDASNLLEPDENLSVDVNVLNGIAYNPEKETFFLTGKNWPKIFEVKFVDEK